MLSARSSKRLDVKLGAVPRYVLEIHELDGSVSKGEHTTPADGEWMQIGEFFQHEGRTLRVADVKDAGGSFDQMLVCSVVQH